MHSGRNVQRGVQRRWQKIIDAQRCSGLTQHQYCEDIGVTLSRFKYWKYKGLRPSSPVSTENNAFLPVSLVQTALERREGGVSLVVAGGTLRLEVGFDENTLRRVVRVLRAEAC